MATRAFIREHGWTNGGSGGARGSRASAAHIWTADPLQSRAGNPGEERASKTDSVLQLSVIIVAVLLG